MHDIKWIRENPQQFDAGLKRRGLAPLSEEILRLDAEQRADKTKGQQLQQEMNALAKEIGMRKTKGENADDLLARSKEMKEKIAGQGEDSLDNPLNQLLLTIPNLLLAEVPDGADESANKELRKWGTPATFTFEPKDHVAIGEGLKLMDFEQTAKISGARFVTLKGQLAKLERALGQFMLDVQTEEHGFTEVNPPLLVKASALYGTGQLPKFESDLFNVNADAPVSYGHEYMREMLIAQNKLGFSVADIQDEKVLNKIDEEARGKLQKNRQLYLIPTSEVSVTNLVADIIIDEEKLPLHYTALTPCFRSEAGSAGRDTRGMIRQHQFNKVEMVSITTPEQAEEEHQRMTGCAEKILQKLELPYRVIVLCTGDTGFGSQKTYDIEVWLPAQKAYREISSCSQFGTFQARRMKARYRPKGEKGTAFVNTLNGSGLAVGRALVAIIENYQTADGSVIVPPVLRPYMGGLECIKR